MMKPDEQQHGPQIPLDPFDLPEPEPVPEKKPPEPAPEPPKKRRSLLPGILAGVAVAAVLLCGYRFVHFWSDATCTEQAECIICGQVKEGYADHTWVRGGCEEPVTCSVCGTVGEQPGGHDWTGGSCTEPRTCADCGAVEEQAPGHSFAGDVCTVCGAARTDGLLKYELTGVYTVTCTQEPDAHTLVIDASGAEDLLRQSFVLRDWTDYWVNKNRYMVEYQDDRIHIILPSDLEPGVYSILAGVQEKKVLDFYWGAPGSWMPVEPNKWFVDFEAMSWKHGKWLAAGDADAPLRGVQTQEEATRFGSPMQMFGVGIDAVGRAVLIPGSGDNVVDAYVCFSADGREETAYAIHYDKWYLAMDAEGTVFLTDTLTEDGLWLIPSSL